MRMSYRAAGAALLALMLGTVQAADESVAAGKELAFSRAKGNCLACHYIDGGASPGNIAPPLMAMSVRFPERAKLRAQIWDATVTNPNTIMPPFGKHRILTEREIDQIVDFIMTL